MLNAIAKQIHSASYNKRKAVMFHYQVLVNAEKLSKTDPKEFCRAVGMNESYATEFRKMIELAQLLKELGGTV